METDTIKTKMRVSRYEKNKNDKNWYKEMLDYLDYQTPMTDLGLGLGFGGDDSFNGERYRNKQINYNLFNGIIDKKDFEYIYKPLGDEVGELPADFSNKDIVSGKIKVLLGMEMERPFSWRVLAVNEEATTRKEEAHFGKVREYVTQQIMKPIQQQIEQQLAEQTKGQQLSAEEQEQLKAKMNQEMQSQTPEEIANYMKRKHQDPAEIMAHQILEYVIKNQQVKQKFNKGWKNASITAEEVYWHGIINDEPVLDVINPLNFQYDKSSDQDFIEDGEWAGVELWMTPSQVVQYFGSELTNTEIDSLYDGYNMSSNDVDFSFDDTRQEQGKVRVVHRAWKALRKLGFLSFIDSNTGQIEERLVDEKYKLNTQQGDINIEWEWIPEVYEGYKINSDIYARMRPVPAQTKNIDNLYECKLPYRGGIYDNINSTPTSLIDRMKMYQWYYNVIMYRVEMLMASDKGKWVLLNMNMIPNSQNIDMKKWLYYADSLKIGFMNPNEEGNQGADISTAAKEIDMSLISDIQKYIELATYIEERCGATIGITKEMEGRVGQYQSAKSAEQGIAQGSYIVEPYFDFHNTIKQNVLTGLLETAIIAYSTNGKKKLNYILDDFSKGIIDIDKELLGLSHYGLFVGNSLDTVRIKEAINNLGLTAMQNQSIDMSDIIKVLKTDSITEAEEKLEVAEDKKRKQNQEADNARMEHENKIAADAKDFKREEWKHEEEMIIVKETERRETELQKAAVVAMGFAEDKDVNDNQIPDVLELAREGLDANIKVRKQDLDEKKFEHEKENDKEKLKIEEKKVNKKTT